MKIKTTNKALVPGRKGGKKRSSNTIVLAHQGTNKVTSLDLTLLE